MFEMLESSPWVEALTNTMAHTLWQGVLLGLLLASTLHFIPVRRANIRYTLALATLAGLVLLPALGVVLPLDGSSGANIVPDPAQEEVTSSAYTRGVETSFLLTARTGLVASLEPFTRPLRFLALPWRMYVVALYGFGVALLSLKLVGQLLYIWRLRRTATPVDEELRSRLQVLADQIDVPNIPHLALSTRVDTAMVMGWRAPLILLPTTTTGLTPKQLDGILLHELVHVRRGDYLVNLLQCVVEALLFYHPAVWWVSGVARREREGRCDDLAVRACGDRLHYAEALLALERNRTRTPIAVASNSGDLTERIERLFNRPAPRTGVARLTLRLALSLALGVGIGFAQEGAVFFQRQPNDTDLRDEYLTFYEGDEIITSNTLEDARRHVPFSMYLPEEVPEGFKLGQLVQVLPQQSLLYLYEGPNLVGEVGHFEFSQQPVSTYKGQPVGASAMVEQVSVAGNPGEYVEGRWKKRNEPNVNEDDLKDGKVDAADIEGWVNAKNTRLLVWQQDGFIFTLAAGDFVGESYGPDRQTMLEIASSLAPTADEQP